MSLMTSQAKMNSVLLAHDTAPNYWQNDDLDNWLYLSSKFLFDRLANKFFPLKSLSGRNFTAFFCLLFCCCGLSAILERRRTIFQAKSFSFSVSSQHLKNEFRYEIWSLHILSNNWNFETQNSKFSGFQKVSTQMSKHHKLSKVSENSQMKKETKVFIFM